MPRKVFINDLQDAAGHARFPKLSNVGPGEDDGTITFTFTSDAMLEAEITVQALVSGKYLPLLLLFWE